jgi:hypothetical protein
VSNLRGAVVFRSKRHSSRWGVPRPGAFLGPPIAAAGGHLLCEAMSRVPWHLINDHHRRAHLVVAVLRADQLGGEPNPRAAQIVLARIVKIQKPSSYYATTVVREAGRPQVHLAFEDKGDARKLATTLDAEPTNTHPGWATEWTLQLDSATVLALAATLPALKKRRKQPHTGPSAARPPSS